MEFSVLFVGLICHIAQPSDPQNKTHAALIDDSDHTPYVDVLGMPPRILKRADHLITFNIGEGTARSEDDFEAAVPHLSRLVSGTIDPAVLARNDHAKVVIYVQYPPGSALSVAEHYEFEGSFQFQTFEQRGCIARVTKLTITSDSVVELLIDNTFYSKLSPNVPCVIGNSSAGGFHFKEHRYLTTSTDPSQIGRAVPLGSKCNKTASFGTKRFPANEASEAAASGAQIHLLTSPQIECTNSQWP